MADGFFLGGVAEGMKVAEDVSAKKGELALGRDKLLADTELRSRGLDIQSRGIDVQDRRLGQDLSLRTRALNIQEQAQKSTQAREVLSLADKQIADTLAVVQETIKAGFDANRDPAVISKAVQPIIASIKKLAPLAGRNPDDFDVLVNTMMARPSAVEAATGETQARVAAAKTVVTETGVPTREALQAQKLVPAQVRDTALEGKQRMILESDPRKPIGELTSQQLASGIAGGRF